MPVSQGTSLTRAAKKVLWEERDQCRVLLDISKVGVVAQWVKLLIDKLISPLSAASSPSYSTFDLSSCKCIVAGSR